MAKRYLADNVKPTQTARAMKRLSGLIILAVK